MLKAPPDEAVRKFGENIRAARTMKCLSQADLAREADVGIEDVTRLEAGDALPEAAIILRIAIALETPPQELCAGVNGSSAMLNRAAHHSRVLYSLVNAFRKWEP